MHPAFPASQLAFYLVQYLDTWHASIEPCAACCVLCAVVQFNLPIDSCGRGLWTVYMKNQSHRLISALDRGVVDLEPPTCILHQVIYKARMTVRAIELSHAACNYKLRRKTRSHG